MSLTTITDSTRTSYSQRRELFTLLLFAVLVVASWVWLPGLVRRGWYSRDPGHITRTLLSLPTHLGVTFASVQAIGIGFFLGLLGMMLFDEKKRIQAVLLWLGVFGLGIMFVFTDFVPRVFAGPLGAHLPWLLAGAVAAVPTCLPVSSWGAVIDRNRTTDGEFRCAASLLCLLVLVSLAAMVLEANLSYPTLVVSHDGIKVIPRPFLDVALVSLGSDLAVAGLFGVVLRRFVAYDRESTVFAVGPSESGKTYFSVGTYFDESTRTNGRVHEAGQELLGKVNEVASHAEHERSPSWSLDSTDTGTAERLWFTIEDGHYFPENLTVETLDYAGENLAGLATLLEAPDLSPSSVEQSDLPPESNLNDVLRLHARVEESDTLLLLLDATSVFSDKAGSGANGRVSGELEAFAPLIQKYADEKRLVFVVTKADVLDEEYQTEVGLDIYDRRNIEQFADQLRYQLTSHPLVGQYLESGDATEVYPVYFRTERTPDGTRVPFRPDDERPLAPYGFSRLLEDL